MSDEKAIEKLRERFAEGEITEEEFKHRKSILEGKTNSNSGETNTDTESTSFEGWWGSIEIEEEPDDPTKKKLLHALVLFLTYGLPLIIILVIIFSL